MMVLVEHVETRAELVEAMANIRGELTKIVRRGHEGKHKSCDDCARIASLHQDLNFMLVAWESAS